MPHLWRHAAALAFIVFACRAQSPSTLQIAVQEGSGALVPQSSLSSRRFAVQVRTADGRPLPGATVNFRLPEQGPTGAFSSGLRSEALMTDEQGLAHVRGILWGEVPGRLQIRVTATHGGQRAEAFIPVEISTTAVPSAADRQSLSVGGRSGAKKWLILVAAAAGALAGIAVAGGGSSPPVASADVATPVTPPSIGAPSITIGRPQ